MADVLALALLARSLTDDGISLDDEASVTRLLAHAHLEHEDPKVRRQSEHPTRMPCRYELPMLIHHRAIRS